MTDRLTEAQAIQMAKNTVPPPAGSHQECRVCRNHYIPLMEQNYIPLMEQNYIQVQCKLYAGKLADEEAKIAIDRELRAITEDSAFIKSTLKSHGDSIKKRWTNWSVKRRGETLSSLAPRCFGGEFRPPVKYAMPAGMEPRDWTFEMPAKTATVDMSVWACEKYKHGCSRMTPWIYIEEFAEDPMRLLSLLHVRSEYTSRDWAEFDTRETLDILGRPPLSFMPPMFNDKCVIMHGDDYGRLTDLDPTMIHTGAIAGFPRAHLTFRVQSTILSELRNVVNAVVDNVRPSGDEEWSKLVGEGFQSSTTELRWGAYFSQAYVPPSTFDPVVLLDMACTQLNYVKDRVECLQTHPAYMRKYAGDIKAHVPWEGRVSDPLKWTYVAGTIITIWTTSLLQWQAVVDISEKLVETCQTHNVSTRLGTTLPMEVVTIFQDWILLVEDVTHVQIYFLRVALADMHAMKDMYKKSARNGKLHGDRIIPDHEWNGRSGMQDKDKLSHRIEIFIRFLLGILRGENAYGARCAFEQLLEQLSKVKPDERVDDVVSTLALLDSMRLQFLSNQLVPYHRAGSTGFTPLAEIDEYETWMMWPQKGVADLESDPQMYGQLGLLLYQLCDSDIKWPDTSDFSRDPPTATAANLLDRSHQAAEARECLKAFWQFVRDNWGSLCELPSKHADTSGYRGLVKERLLVSDEMHTCMRAVKVDVLNILQTQERLKALEAKDTRITKGIENEVFPCLNEVVFRRLPDNVIQKAFENMSFDLQPKYLAAIEEERELFNTKIQIARFLAEQKKASQSHMLQSTWGTAHAGGSVVMSGHEKVKTTGTATGDTVVTPKEEQLEVLDEASKQVRRVLVAVKQDSLNLFKDMFSRHSKFGNYRWESFIRAMGDAGYSATQAEGARVSFAGEQGSNVFHQPHDRTIDPIMLRRFGESFNSRFGWDSETFVLRAKTDEPCPVEEPKKKKKSKKPKRKTKSEIDAGVEGLPQE